MLRGDVGVVLAENAGVELCQRPRGLDAGRTAAHYHDVQRAILHAVGLAVGRLPPLQDMVLEAHGVREGVQREGVL